MTYQFKILIFLLIFLHVSIKSYTQSIYYVKHKYNADYTVFFTNNKYEADVIIFKTTKRYNVKDGWWFIENKPTSHSFNIFVTSIRHQADFKIYLTNKYWEVRLNENYLKKFRK